MDGATAEATTDAGTMGVAITGMEDMGTDPDTVIEGGAALQVVAAIAAVEVDFAVMAADSTAEITVDSVAEAFAAETASTVAEAVAFTAVADSTAAVIAVEDPTVVAIGNFDLNTESLRG